MRQPVCMQVLAEVHATQGLDVQRHVLLSLLLHKIVDAEQASLEAFWNPRFSQNPKLGLVGPACRAGLEWKDWDASRLARMQAPLRGLHWAKHDLGLGYQTLWKGSGWWLGVLPLHDFWGGRKHVRERVAHHLSSHHLFFWPSITPGQQQREARVPCTAAPAQQGAAEAAQSQTQQGAQQEGVNHSCACSLTSLRSTLQSRRWPKDRPCGSGCNPQPQSLNPNP